MDDAFRLHQKIHRFSRRILFCTLNFIKAPPVICSAKHKQIDQHLPQEGLQLLGKQLPKRPVDLGKGEKLKVELHKEDMLILAEALTVKTEIAAGEGGR